MIWDGGCQRTATTVVDGKGNDDGGRGVGQSGMVMMEMMRRERERDRWGFKEDHLLCRRRSLFVIVVLVYTAVGTARRRSL